MPLPPETERLWNRLKDAPALFDAVLVGGTALEMSLHHRASEDLDFAFPSIRLPVSRLKALVGELDADGWSFEPNDNPAAEDDFILSGMDLRDYHQDYVVNGKVKVTFFAPDTGNQKLLSSGNSAPRHSGPRVASVSEIFGMKALVASSRSRSRDWLDLYVLMTQHGFTMSDFAEAYRTAGMTGALDTALNRITSGRVEPQDPGYLALMPNPPELSDIVNFFIQQRDDYERGLAAKRFGG